MSAVIEYFTHISTMDRAILIVGGFALLWMLESAFGASRYARVLHARTNLVFWISSLVINLCVSGLTLGASFTVTREKFGILNLVELPLWLNVVLSIALLDFVAAYVHHRMVHAVPVLWKFHLVHHSDPHVDSTTALRHSPVEAVIRSGFTLGGVIVLGVSPGVLVAYQAVALWSAQWIHSDIHLPRAVDSLLSRVWVSPGMHRVHHHKALPYTDTNYGTIFSVWDRLFGTFRTLDTDEVVFGIDSIPESADREQSAVRLMRLALLPASEGYRARAQITHGRTVPAQPRHHELRHLP
ncbi:MAG TPA: sterol desaturase family protein [Candidatus Limnocylindrales bacterium]|nr:sterol desaturase family protein [Candidatus Limnocylindrales bacterium]